MMRWLLTVQKGYDQTELRSRLAAWGCEISSAEDPVPLSELEEVIEVDGPPNLPDRVQDDRQILKVSPSSELQLF